MMKAAVLLAAGASVGGLYLSYYGNVAAGAAVAGLMVGAYLLVLAGSRLARRL